MNKLLGFAIGFAIGAVIGAGVVIWYSPATGEKLIGNLQRGYRDTMDDARRASEQRRAELEAQLHTLR